MDEKVACYCRVSSDEQRENETIEIQEEFLSSYCHLYALPLIHPVGPDSPYRDNGVSGAVPLHERPGGAKLLEDIEKGLVGTVLVRKLDRVGRTLVNVLDAHDRMEAAGASLKSAAEPIDTSTISGRLIFHMLASFAEYDRENIRERTLGGMKRFFRAGKFNGRVPYGYDVKDSLLVVEEDEAKVVRELMMNLASGSTIRGEARRLNAEGVPAPGHRYAGSPRKHGPGWTTTTVSKMVSRPTYAGTHVVRSAGEEIARGCPPIVEEALWERAKAQVTKNKTSPVHTKGHPYLLSGLMRCGVCGSLYRGNGKGKGQFYYQCGDSLGNSLVPKLPRNHAPILPAAQVEAHFWNEIKGFVENPESVVERLEAQGDETEVGGLEERKQHLAKRLREKNAEKDRYVRLYAKGTLSEEEADGYIQAAMVETNHLRLLLSAVESDIAESRMEEEQNRRTVDWLLRLSGKLEEAEAETKEAFATRRALAELFIDSITVSRDEDGYPVFDTVWNFNEPEDSVSNSFVYVPNRRDSGDDEHKQGRG